MNEYVDSDGSVTVNGTTFNKLGPNDRGRLLAPVKAARRIQFQKDLKDAGVTGEAYVNELDAFDQNHWADREFLSYMQSIEGQSAIITLACKKANSAQFEKLMDGLALGMEEAFKLTRDLAGVKPEPADSPARKLWAARVQLKMDLRDAGIAGDAYMRRLDEFDAKNQTEEPESRPSDAGS